MDELTNTVNAESVPAQDDQSSQEIESLSSQPIAESPGKDETQGITETITPEEEFPEEGKKGSSAEKRIKQLLSRQKQAQQQADAARQEAEFWKVRAQGVPDNDAQVIREPNIDDFETYEDFLVAKTRHEMLETQKRENIQQAQQQIDRNFMERIQKASINNPDIYTIINDNSLPISPAMGITIKNSENASDILIYLDAHRAEALKIAQLDPLSAIKEMGKLELQITNASKPEPVRKVSLAPEPIKPPESNGPAIIDLEKVSMNEYMRARNRGMVTGRLKRK